MEQNCKKQLYSDVARIKRFMIFRKDQYGINLVQEYNSFGIKLKAIPFKTHGLRGMAAIAEAPDPDVILLNTKRSPLEQNFDCGHETMHLGLHRHTGQKTFNCYDEVTAKQNPFLEWQANEGSAEFFVPHRIFIPMLHEVLGLHPTFQTVQEFIRLASNTFMVPRQVIRYRLENLKYEILQFYIGIDVYDLELLSKAQQERKGLYIRSLNSLSYGEQLDMCEYIQQLGGMLCEI
ncbi:ImmA/IrrE family metallo-endopeptidase [Enterocloster asparagiformis]|uniref:ImmA/IrrE family metallo-endopeptidase n=1 Tax=Enterocloster asparagiformis TaxID=333367 RepID=UPI002A814BC3|nr:ImmA/IrrE family metallo-endopeptidase [Enterocloster asparagiformis]